MKKLMIFLAGLLLTSCSINETVEAQFEFGSGIHRVAWYDKGTPKEELMEYVSNTSNADNTTYFYFFPKEEDVSAFNTQPYSETEFYQTVVDSKPDYGFYKMTTDSKVYDDALWVLEQSLRPKE